MKIAVITDDQKTISQHFGRAPYYLVLTVEDGQITNRELRDKIGHHSLSGKQQTEHEHTPGAGHGMDAASQNRHVSMAEVIGDCQALICGGMGTGAYQSMQALNIKPVVTDLRMIDEAVQAYLDGKLQDRVDLLH